MPNYTNEQFIVRKVAHKQPITFQLKHIHGGDIQGGFYSEDLLKVKHPNLHLIEKVLYKTGNRVRVKWIGFDATHNSWVNANEIVP